jgi:hypothetical protein
MTPEAGADSFISNGPATRPEMMPSNPGLGLGHEQVDNSEENQNEATYVD